MFDIHKSPKGPDSKRTTKRRKYHNCLQQENKGTDRINTQNNGRSVTSRQRILIRRTCSSYPSHMLSCLIGLQYPWASAGTDFSAADSTCLQPQNTCGQTGKSDMSESLDSHIRAEMMRAAAVWLKCCWFESLKDQGSEIQQLLTSQFKGAWRTLSWSGSVWAGVCKRPTDLQLIQSRPLWSETGCWTTVNTCQFCL